LFTPPFPCLSFGRTLITFIFKIDSILRIKYGLNIDWTQAWTARHPWYALFRNPWLHSKYISELHLQRKRKREWRPFKLFQEYAKRNFEQQQWDDVIKKKARIRILFSAFSFKSDSIVIQFSFEIWNS
jgi:hypothetical protein